MTIVASLLVAVLLAAAPVNCHVRQYDGEAIDLKANGNGPATLVVRRGDFPIWPNAEHDVATNARQANLRADDRGRLAIPLEPAGPVEIRIQPAAERARGAGK